jgi:formyl-CoA transferase
VLIAGNADALYRRLMSAIGREDLRDDPALARNDGRAAQMERIDAAIAAWTSRLSLDEVLDRMQKAEVPAGRIYSAADIAADPHYAARGMIEEIVAGDGERLKVPGIVPKLSATPGAIRSPAPNLGEHTDEVLGAIGYARDEIAEFRKKGIV